MRSDATAACASQEDVKLFNQRIFEKLASDNGTLRKEAADDINDFTRLKMREDGFSDKIIPAQPISNDELDRVVGTDKPYKVVDKEPDSPAAISVPFGTLPMNLYIRGPRYAVMFDRVMTTRFTKDVDELRTWIMDIRQVMSDNAIKDMLAELDGKFLTACNTSMVAQGATVPTSQTIQWEGIPGSISRDSLWDMMKVLPSTPSHLEVHTILVNNITIKEVCKFGRTEQGGDLSQDIMKQGWTLEEYMGVRWIISIKTDLVPTNTAFLFADPKFMGKSFELEATTMYIRREAFMLEFFAYLSRGLTIGNTNSVGRVDFAS